MALVKTYSLANCQFAWNGLDMNSGVGADSVLTATREFDEITTSSNSAGDNANTRNHNKLGNIEFSLMQNSEVHGLLMAKAVAVENAVEDYYFNFTVIDPSSHVQMTARNCWVKKKPDFVRGNDASEVTWMFGCDALEFIPVP